MTLKVYNTLSKQKEDFKPIDDNKVKMYVCGMTVYDDMHMGHARSIVVFDMIVRYLRWKSYDVTHVTNFTDIDDKIINRAAELGIPPLELSKMYIDKYFEDVDSLGIKRADIYPKASECIQDIIDMIAKIMENGFGYIAEDGSVYFSVDKVDNYGRLTGQKLEDMVSGTRVDIEDAKRNPMDFALWKAAKPGEVAWDTPWGKGRPGWHIECSAMSQKYLGESFDIHGGGQDLIFPHHENEIAQSEGATGKPFARYWLHNGFVNINQEKMSKSLGNFLSNREILSHYHPEVVRIFLLSNHYRSPVDFSGQNLQEAKSHLERFYALLKDLKDLQKDCTDSASMNEQEHEVQQIISELPDRFQEAMDDDFNTAAALGNLNFCLRNVNGWLNQVKKEERKQVPRALMNEATHTFSKIGQVLGLFLEDPDHYFDQQKVE
ncbi:MAG TPA: cysteine--tRNA ligase, partial [Methanomassiliicoccales archaeon]|nr:cysteine--tRNA ligase [Methanomassiliicoccales archaeon]